MEITLLALGVGFALGCIFNIYMSRRLKKLSLKGDKRHYYSRIVRDNGHSFSSNSGSTEISSDAILSSMQDLFKRDGRVVIDFIDEEEIHCTSLKTIKVESVEAKLDEIKELIRENLLVKEKSNEEFTN